MSDSEHGGIGGMSLLEALLDPGSFESWDTVPVEPELGGEYAAQLDAARARSGADEAILTGRGTISGRAAAVIVSEFGFLAGSIGQAAAQRIVDAVERATREGLPLLASPASGGTRMQEGTPAFLAMIPITDAVRRHKEAGLPYVVYLRHPTTGGAMASWGSLGHITAAEPGALIGFLGPRVYELLEGRTFPEGVQVAENLQRRGIIDTVLPPAGLAEFVGRVLRILQTPSATHSVVEFEGSAGSLGGHDAWESICRSRDPLRPGGTAVIHAAGESLRLSGTGEGENESGIALSLARFGTEPCVVIAHQRGSEAENAALGPASLRVAQRGIRIADELGLPIVTIIDTSGAELSAEAEEGAIAGEIARSLSALLGTRSPTVSVLLGQGNGGGALALLPADRTIAAENAWLSPLPPEGASAIVHRSVAFAAQMAEVQRVDLRHLRALGLVDAVVAEPQDAGVHQREFVDRVVAAIEREISVARAIPDADRQILRSRRFTLQGRASALDGCMS